MVLTGLSCCALPLANNLFQLAIPHFGLGLGVGIVDAVLVPLLANLVDSRGSSQYGPVYALQQASVSLAYSFGPLLGGEAVRVFGFPWLIRIVGFMNLLFCPLLLELEKNKVELSVHKLYKCLLISLCFREIDLNCWVKMWYLHIQVLKTLILQMNGNKL